MAALGCPDNMAAVVSAVEQMEEYVQVVVGEDGDTSQVVVVQGAGGELLRPVPELSPEILQSISQTDTVFFVQPDGSLVAGGSLDDMHAGVRLVTAGSVAEAEADQPEVSLETGGHEMEASHHGVSLVTRGHIEEAAHSGVSLVTGGHMVQAVQSEMSLETGGPVEEAVESGGQELEVVQPAVNLTTSGQVVEGGHQGMILVPGGHIEENLVNGSQVHLGMDVLTGGGLQVSHPDLGMVTALNLTKEAAQCSITDGDQTQETATTDISQGSIGAPEIASQGVLQSQSLPVARPTTNSAHPTFSSAIPMLKDAAQQLKTVAHHVALREGDSVTRILNHKQLKSIQVQVPSTQIKKNADPVVLNLSTVRMKNTSPNLLGAQVVQIKSVRESGQPVVVNSSSLEPSIQFLLRQAQLSAAKSRTPDCNKNIGEPLEEHRSCVAHPQNGSHALCLTDHAQKKGHKRKKSIKIKTRSGRISRPPKHKAKDYKFLKVGDMIQGSSSDSEDYSEMSTDEDEKGAKENAPCDLPPHTVKNSLFQCQTCEKSYMGKGGLSRHYRLYPSHGQMEPQFVSDAKKNGESGVGGHSLPSEPKKPRPRKRLLADPLNSDSSLPNLATDGLEFVPVSTTCRGRRQMTGRRYGRPRKILAMASSEQNALTAKEMIQQSEDADLKEHVAPCFSRRLSVYDFLLVKVKQEHPDKPLFPQLYKELEKLHSMVRILAQEYFSVGKTLEVADSKVAASLGISAEKIVQVSPAVTCSVKDDQRIQSVEENTEDSVEELMPPSKRLKVEEAESVNSTKGETTTNAVDVHEAEQTDIVSIGDELSFEYDPSSGTNNYTEISHPHVTEEEAESQHMITEPESIPRDIEQNLMEGSPPLLSTNSPQLCDSTPISIESTEESLSDAILTQVVQGNKEAEEGLPGSHSDHLQCPQASDPVFTSDGPPPIVAEKTQIESFQGVDTLTPTEVIANDQCTQAFSFTHGQDLMLVHSSEEITTGEAIVIYDSTASPADTQLDTVVALMEKK
ncbi:zinc finger protein 839 [Leptodactylus fuscus]|uniref:zinc finger protein 839 n=1 Tax=Leptodactylus fuscus TaxID=238119 RepID=UPI003F4E6C4A